VMDHVLKMDRGQGCQMAYFQTQNPNLNKFWRVLQWKMLAYYMSIIWCIFSRFRTLY
jgi:hypothetical protein